MKTQRLSGVEVSWRRRILQVEKRWEILAPRLCTNVLLIQFVHSTAAPFLGTGHDGDIGVTEFSFRPFSFLCTSEQLGRPGKQAPPVFLRFVPAPGTPGSSQFLGRCLGQRLNGFGLLFPNPSLGHSAGASSHVW